jgi:hypothetical protein
MSDARKVDRAKLDAIREWYDLVLTLPELRARRERLEALRAEVPPEFRSAFGLLTHYLDDWVDAIEEDDPEGRVNARRLLRRGPAWMRRPESLQEIRSYIRLEQVGDVTSVDIEWHRVPRDLREATISLASMVVDASEGRFRKGGRPRRKRPPKTG